MRSSVPSTFSIVGFDPKTKDLGVAVESKFVAVGAVVPFAQAGVGAVATQSYANTTFGPKALGMMKQRVAPKDVLQRLVKADKEAARRQVGLVDARGRPASYTGKECFHWAGHVVGQHYACQGNLLAGADVVKEMGRAFERTQGDLPVRLLAALSSGKFDSKTKAAFEAWASVNNFENKVRSDGKVWGSVFRAFRAAVSPGQSQERRRP